MKDDPDQYVRMNALLALIELFGDQGRELAREIFWDDAAGAVQEALVEEFWSQRQEPEVRQLLQRYVHNEDPETRQGALMKVLPSGVLGPDEVHGFLDDRSEDVRSLVLQHCIHRGPMAPYAWVLEYCLDDEDDDLNLIFVCRDLASSDNPDALSTLVRLSREPAPVGEEAVACIKKEVGADRLKKLQEKADEELRPAVDTTQNFIKSPRALNPVTAKQEVVAKRQRLRQAGGRKALRLDRALSRLAAGYLKRKV